MKFNLTASCALGLESVVARELLKLNMGEIHSENGRVRFVGEEVDICRANLWLRSADRVWWSLKKFPCSSFEELFVGVKEIPWAKLMPVNAEFPVDAHTYRSKLTSLPAIQRTAKKAVVEVMQSGYRRTILDENGAHFPIKVFLANDECEVLLDTSGSGLHKRGYRTWNAPAPLRETLAAGLIQLSYWNKDRLLIDPFCGSGTICLEAAMIGLNMAPGLTRKFASESWSFIGNKVWQQALEEAEDLLDRRTDLHIAGFDNNAKTLKLARLHLQQCGLEDRGIQFQERDIRDFSSSARYGVLITNPPYGERLLDIEEAEYLYTVLGSLYKKMSDWSFYVISSHPDFEACFGSKAQRRRKLYNGMIACNYFQYLGPKPKN
ncbi:MAG: class I SAM-dependent RNA methyltransferase [Candidatus Bruticola sp.]